MGHLGDCTMHLGLFTENKETEYLPTTSVAQWMKIAPKEANCSNLFSVAVNNKKHLRGRKGLFQFTG